MTLFGRDRIWRFYMSWDWINFNFTSSFLRSYKAALLSSFLLLENNHGWLKLIYTVLFSKYNFSWTWRYYLCQHGFQSYQSDWKPKTRYPGTTTDWSTTNRTYFLLKVLKFWIVMSSIYIAYIFPCLGSSISY